MDQISYQIVMYVHIIIYAYCFGTGGCTQKHSLYEVLTHSQGILETTNVAGQLMYGKTTLHESLTVSFHYLIVSISTHAQNFASIQLCSNLLYVYILDNRKSFQF